jgi:MEDS: MEthanogen/methylotroph, DcmR Sensory domain
MLNKGPGREAGHFHAVRFYEDAQSLARMVATFVAEGFIGGLPAVIVATPEHRDAIIDKLNAMSFDLSHLKRRGDLIVLDARDMLDSFMIDGMPNAEQFEAAMLPVIDKACRKRQDCVIRAYGEMVDVLWKDGFEAAAVRLEMLWNQLANTRQFSLLCGYSMGNFYKAAAFDAICHQHTHVLSTDGAAAPVTPRSERRLA